MAQTCHNLANGGHERWTPTQSCGGIVGWGISAASAAEVLSYTLHEHNHHQLEKIVKIIGISGNTAGIIYSKKHGAL
jgi:hypothetical protein